MPLSSAFPPSDHLDSVGARCSVLKGGMVRWLLLFTGSDRPDQKFVAFFLLSLSSLLLSPISIPLLAISLCLLSFQYHGKLPKGEQPI